MRYFFLAVTVNGYATATISSNGQYGLQSAVIKCTNALGVCNLYCNSAYSCKDGTLNGKQAGKVYVGAVASYGFTEGILYCPSDNEGIYSPSCHLWCEAEQSCTKAEAYAVGGIGGYESGLIEYYCKYPTSCVAMQVGCGATYSEVCYIANTGIWVILFDTFHILFFVFILFFFVTLIDANKKKTKQNKTKQKKMWEKVFVQFQVPVIVHLNVKIMGIQVYVIL